jgi:RimJ/RimL family protein N-acetyltransferase
MKKIELKPLLSGERITLKKHDRLLAQTMYEYVEQDRERLSLFLPWVDYIKGPEDEKKYIESTHEKWTDGTLFDYGVFRTDSDTYMGNIGVHTIRWDHHCAELGYWILGKYEGRGFMSEAVCVLEKHLFEVGFHRIQIRCSDLNDRSEKVPIACGYLFEGTAREDCIEKGKYRNTKTFSKLATN